MKCSWQYFELLGHVLAMPFFEGGQVRPPIALLLLFFGDGLSLDFRHYFGFFSKSGRIT